MMGKKADMKITLWRNYTTLINDGGFKVKQIPAEQMEATCRVISCTHEGFVIYKNLLLLVSVRCKVSGQVKSGIELTLRERKRLK